MIEALVASALVAIGIASAAGGLGSLTRAQAASQERERMQRLAVSKYEEIVTVGLESAPTSGDFSDWLEDRYRWEATVGVTSTENLQSLEVTVGRSDQIGGTTTIQGLVYTPQAEGAE